jgi:hypothetical protein
LDDPGDSEKRLGPGNASVPSPASGKIVKPRMKRESFTNIWDAIEDDPAVAANTTMRADLLIALQKHVETGM